MLQLENQPYLHSAPSQQKSPSHLRVSSMPLSATPQIDKEPGGASRIASNHSAKLIPSSNANYMTKSFSTQRGAHSEQPIMIDDDEPPSLTPKSFDSSGSRQRIAKNATDGGQTASRGVSAALFAPSRPNGQPIGPEHISFIRTPSTKAVQTMASDVQRPSTAQSSPALVKSTAALEPGRLKTLREQLAAQPWIKAAAERRKARESVAPSMANRPEDSALGKPHQPVLPPRHALSGTSTAGHASHTLEKAASYPILHIDNTTVTSKPKPTPDGISFVSNDLAAVNPKRKEREQEIPAVSTSISKPDAQETHPIRITTPAEEGVEEPPAPKRQRRGSFSTMSPPSSNRPVETSHSVATLPTSAAPSEPSMLATRASASYEEVPISDGILKLVKMNGRLTYQLQFTQGIHSCEHVATADEFSNQPLGLSRKLEEARAIGQDQKDNDKIGEVHHLIARWRTRGHTDYLLEWTDESRDWVARADINKELVSKFDADYRGIDQGVKILGTRGKGAKQQYRLQWEKRPAKETCWVPKKLISKRLLQEYEEAQAATAKELPPRPPGLDL
ncbi:hypothetical protein PG999_005442 [Apiospora kogelbergensis]|uniref:Chromo domain-containing protein n=1 Tax=Apiospora kogelbergensis TaxID=1337665 RepID=A0AAW0R278_9PEZI